MSSHVIIFQIFVAVHDQNIVIAGLGNRIVSSGAEIIYPVKMVNIGSISAGDFYRMICGTGINNNNFPIIKGKAAQTFANILLFVFCDDTDRNGDHILLPPIFCAGWASISILLPNNAAR